MSDDNTKKLLRKYDKIIQQFNNYISEKKYDCTIREFLENLDFDE